jgi:uncharacterized tellurite resistance protein B-like protein
LVAANPSDIVAQIQTASRRRRLWPYALTALILATCIPVAGPILLLLGIPGILWLRLRDRGRRTVVIFYEVSDEPAAGFAQLVDAHEQLGQSQQSWHIQARADLATTHQRKVNAGASSLNQRGPARLSTAGPSVLATNIAVPSLNTKERSVYFLPDRVLVRQGKDFAELPYSTLRVHATTQRFIEDVVAPRDAQQVGVTWRYANVKGGPDRRYKNNRQLPILLYGRLTLTSPDGFLMVWDFSRPDVASAFAARLSAMRTPSLAQPPAATASVTPPIPGQRPDPLEAPTQAPNGRPSPRPAASRPHQVGPEPAPTPRWQWIPPGHQAKVAGLTLPNGFIYIGNDLRASIKEMIEPALIDPSLPVDREHLDWEGRGLTYSPAYAKIPPGSRAAYLAWLADGRRFPAAPMGYVFLFFYGLERRALADALRDPAARQDAPAIIAEVRRLLGIYGSNASFRSYASQFLDALDLVAASAAPVSTTEPPPLDEDRSTVPMRLRLALAAFAAEGTPVPASWARAWAWYHPQIYPRTPQTRCPDEFNQLFTLRYHERFNDGLTIRPGKARLRLSYHAASAGIGTAEMTAANLPDVFEQAATTRKLTDLVDAVTNDLDAYSRWLGRNPDGRGSLAAAALLPIELVNGRSDRVAQLHSWVDGLLADNDTAVIKAEDLIGRWPTAVPGKMTKAEAVSVAQVLGHLGVGIEPDVRFGGAALMPGPAVLFRTGNGASQAPSSNFNAATILLHLSVAVGQADGHVSNTEHEHLTARLESTLGLPAPEQVRLRAHLRWLIAAGVKLTGLKKRLEALHDDQRLSVADFLLTIAAADGVIDPGEVTTLTRIYMLLGLDPSTVYAQLHERVANVERARRQQPATDPVVVRPAAATPQGFALPTTPPAPSPRPNRPDPATVAANATPQVVLDQQIIDAKLAETANVAALLATIFTDDEPTTAPSAPVGRHIAPASSATPPGDRLSPDAAGLPVSGLDVPHTHLLRELAAAPVWSRQAFEELTRRHNVLPTGALDVLNEAAIDNTGDPVIEGEEELTINTDVLQEMLG